MEQWYSIRPGVVKVRKISKTCSIGWDWLQIKICRKGLVTNNINLNVNCQNLQKLLFDISHTIFDLFLNPKVRQYNMYIYSIYSAREGEWLSFDGSFESFFQSLRMSFIQLVEYENKCYSAYLLGPLELKPTMSYFAAYHPR